MSIDHFIFPRFKRFSTMNLGLKRMLFLISFPLFIFGLGVFLYSLLVGDLRNDEPLIILGIIVGSYLGFWVFVRLVYWVVDGFLGK
jgi:hypothetical protein